MEKCIPKWVSRSEHVSSVVSRDENSDHLALMAGKTPRWCLPNALLACSAPRSPLPQKMWSARRDLYGSFFRIQSGKCPEELLLPGNEGYGGGTVRRSLCVNLVKWRHDDAMEDFSWFLFLFRARHFGRKGISGEAVRFKGWISRRLQYWFLRPCSPPIMSLRDIFEGCSPRVRS